MPTFRRFLILLSLLFVMLITAPAMAEGDSEKEEEGKSWVLAYITVVLMVGNGIFIVGYGTNRETEELRKKERKEAQEKEERLKKLEQH